MPSSQRRHAAANGVAWMIGVQLRSELLERPIVGSDGGLELRLHGVRVLADADTRMSGLVSSVDGVLQRVRVGDTVDVDGVLAGAGQVSAVSLHMSRLPREVPDTP